MAARLNRSRGTGTAQAVPTSTSPSLGERIWSAHLPVRDLLVGGPSYGPVWRPLVYPDLSGRKRLAVLARRLGSLVLTHGAAEKCTKKRESHGLRTRAPQRRRH